VSYQYARPDLVPTVVAPAAAASASTLLSEAQEACERISKYLGRLSEVRAKREAMDAALKAAQGGWV
jgi:elongator complex protein 1